MMTEKRCNWCGIKKPVTEFTIDQRWGTPLSECKSCRVIRRTLFVGGIDPNRRSENKSCSQYLGICVAEKLLSNVFEKVIRMPLNNRGYDFICNKGFKVEVKSACRTKWQNNWIFNIKKNTTPDYFCCIAFDNRESLEPEHFWIIPGKILNGKVGTSIGDSTIKRWVEFEKPIDKISSCCDRLRDHPQ